MREYTVTWIIEVDAANHVEAAKKAAEIMQDPDSIATVFEVRRKSYEAAHLIDLKKFAD